MKLKVCGLTNRENILQVLNCKPDYIGFIFYNKSPRYIGGLSSDFVQNIASAKKVGVFVNETEIKILDCVSCYGLDFVQLHGDESPGFCSEINKSVPVIKAFRVDDDFDFSSILPFENTCHYFLFDSKNEKFGGSGQPFNHEKLREYKLNKPFFLSGGLSLENINKIKNENAYCLDVNSKFEISPGIKDIDKLKLINI